MRPSQFKKDSTFFHLNVPFKTTGYFKELDWMYLQRNLFRIANQFSIELQALVMMDTHFHVLIEVRDENENFFCDEVAKKLAPADDQAVFCEPVSNLAQYLNAYKYIYNNPIKAGMTATVETYPYSSLQILLGRSSCHCLIADKLGFIQNPRKIINWLNSDLKFKDSELKVFLPS
ncbi:MAG: hypothetical protein A2622_06385 [Bdellovibrionales bacterium RIFCSPHIGHO2_01_FULL_40_29]|nr:MAG: hypothetical protein A2622_06385 [Bdellovibrionales bacterium RIFCSPHIGHO2_01_FULL_40_29]OFZ35072.1 MAG: hypothetical protein A3D17_06735 [Bdellovibrionales bacterium RIFCSPHIGHO2_02_FULL_40_15]